MKENANAGLRYTVDIRENLGIEEGTTATSMSLETGTQISAVQRTNNIIEAYTGNDVSHKEVRTS